MCGGDEEMGWIVLYLFAGIVSQVFKCQNSPNLYILDMCWFLYDDYFSTLVFLKKKSHKPLKLSQVVH